MASPSASELEPPSSPIRAEGRSFVSQAATEDEDTRMMDGSPEPNTSQRTSRGKGSRAAKDKDNQAVTGKIRHLKKDDGEPLWRKDIQYDFLRAIFDNDQKVFTNSYESRTQCFADLYIDTMARSSKTSKILRDKLLTDRDAAKGMAMVCLLVNIGRMNTTLNFFPEMRAQLRTYHAIPSLQAEQDPHAYKQLQDAPRLKSILKGGMEDREEPNTLEKIKNKDVPRTNPVNLIFVICSAAAKIAELHFPPTQEFHDLITKTYYTSESRARAFLWIMWFYLESDFTEEGCDENPFGPGVDYGVSVANQGVPRLQNMTKEEEETENVDTESERQFGLEKLQMRKKILDADHQIMVETQTKRGGRQRNFPDEGPAILPRIRPSKHESDMESTRSTPPPKVLARSLGQSRRGGAPLKYQIFEGSSPAGPSHQGPDGVVTRKPRPPTAHQLAVERNRSQRVEYLLDRGMRKRHHKSRKTRRAAGAIIRSHRRVQKMEDPFANSEDEDAGPANLGVAATFRERGLGGLAQLSIEDDEFGEEAASYAAALRRVKRRLERWEAQPVDAGVVAPVKRRKTRAAEAGADNEQDEDEPRRRKTNGVANGDSNGDINGEEGEEGDEVDEADRTGIAGSGGEDEDDVDEADKTLADGESEME